METTLDVAVAGDWTDVAHVLRANAQPYCTLAVTLAFPLSVKAQVRVLSPPLEQAPDQMASRPLVTDSVIRVPLANVVEPVLPTATLMPAGVDRTLSPLRPEAVTVSIALCACGFTVSVAVRVRPLCAAAIVTGVDALTADVVAANVALLAPAATETLPGTTATPVLLLVSVTTAPPVGAAAVNVTVPCDGVPPVTLVGLRVTPWRLAAGGSGVTVSVVVLLMALYEAVSVTGVLAVTAAVATANDALVAPAATVTLVGTVAALVLLLVSATTAPPDGAAADKVSVPVDAVPPTTDDGLTVTADNAAAAETAPAVKRRVTENGPNTPAEFRARTRHHNRCAGRASIVAWDPVTTALATNGDAMLDVLSI